MSTPKNRSGLSRPEIAAVVDEYVSRSLSASEFEHGTRFRPRSSALHRASQREVGGERHARCRLARRVVRLCGHSARSPVRLRPRHDVTWYIDDGCRNLSDTARRTYRGNLRRIARLVVRGSSLGRTTVTHGGRSAALHRRRGRRLPATRSAARSVSDEWSNGDGTSLLRWTSGVPSPCSPFGSDAEFEPGLDRARV